MTKKSILTKVLPAALIFVLVLLLVVIISSCTKTKKVPQGTIGNEEYLSIPLSDGKTKKITEKEFYNLLRYVGYDAFSDEIAKAIFTDEYDAIITDLEENKTSIENSNYYDKFVKIIDTEIYETADKDEIDELSDEEKQAKIEKFFDSEKLLGITVEGDTPYQYNIFVDFAADLARAEYARSVLLVSADEVDGEDEITLDKIAEKFDEKYINTDDITMIMIRFRSESEIKETLKYLGLKFVNSKLYRVTSESEDSYDDDYDNFSTSEDGVCSLSDSEVLFEYMRIYNYIYSYRNQITLRTNDYEDALEAYDGLSSAALTTLYTEIYNTPVDELRDQLIEQNSSEFPKFIYTKDELTSMDSSITSKIYDDYSANENSDLPQYTTAAANGKSDYYLFYKLEDASKLAYNDIKTLADYVNAVENDYSSNAIYNYLQHLGEIFAEEVVGMTDAEKTSFYTDLAESIGAADIISKAVDKTDPDSIWSILFEERLDKPYIDEIVDDHFKDDCKITIYDELFEVLFGNTYKWYEAGKKQSNKYVFKTKVNGVTNYLTVDDFFTILEKKYGAAVTFNMELKTVLKDLYYDQITDEEKEDWEEEYVSVMANFNAGSFSSYGYDASIGQKAFMQLYFTADNKDDAIFNTWVSPRLVEIFLYENSTDLNENLYADFATLANLAYNNALSLDAFKIDVYTDDNEDGIDDNPAEYSPARKAEVEGLTVELLNAVYTEMQFFSSSSFSTAIENIQVQYEKSGRVSDIYLGDTITEPFTTETERNAYLWGKFKKAGLFLRVEEQKTYTASTIKTLDENLQDQLLNIYNWALTNADDDEKNYFAKAVTLDENDACNEPSPEIATTSNLLITETGYVAIYAVGYDEALSAKFTTSDNPNDSANGKAFPYSTDIDNPYPLDTDAMDDDDDTKVPLDNTGESDSLYNTGDTPTANQILVYVREKLDGIISLSDSVVTALDSYFNESVFTYYVSGSNEFVLVNKLLESYAVTGAGYDRVKDGIDILIETKKNNIFSYDQSPEGSYMYNFIEQWWEIFE